MINDQEARRNSAGVGGNQVKSRHSKREVFKTPSGNIPSVFKSLASAKKNKHREDVHI